VLPETILSRTEVDTPLDADAAEEPAESPRFPLLNMIALGVILALLAIVGLVIGRSLLAGAGPPLSPTPLLQPQPTELAASAAPAPTGGALATFVPSPVAAAQPSASPPVAPAPPASAGPAQATPALPAPTAGPAGLPLGTILNVDGWSATLLRPDYALLLDGAVGGLQPAGRFVLTMLAVTNNSPDPRRIPSDLFVLSDAQGRRYNPLPGASSAFLGAYGRGQYGDLALEDEIEPQSGMRTIPVLFDVPLDASGMALSLAGAGGAGWPIDGAPTLPAGP
jgi:hypothetical protein